MKTNPSPKFVTQRGYVSYLMVVSLGLILLTLMLGIYRSAMQSQDVQRDVNLRVDYSEKEDAIIRAMVPIVANRAMRSMQHNSTSNSYPLRWQRIFRSSIDEAFGSESISNDVLVEFGLGDAVQSNVGDAVIWSSETFRAYEGGGYTTPGTNADYGDGFPIPMQADSLDVTSKDHLWPIISDEKFYGNLADGRVGASVTDYPQYNLISYPDIRFGYAQPGEPFVAKHNWWAFRMNLSDHQEDQTKLHRRDREFIVSIYEVPSQLGISAESFTVLGQHADGSDWQNITIEGGIYATRARLSNNFNIDWISGRRGLEFDQESQVAGSSVADWNNDAWTKQDTDGNDIIDPFQRGVRENYETFVNNFMPVSLASEAGSAAFIPINRGAAFFDRYGHAQESNTISPTTWNEYSIGAMQAAMHLDITDVEDEDDPTPTELTFQYYKGGVKESMVIRLDEGDDIGLPSGYLYVADEHESVFFEEPVDVAYGKNGTYYFEEEVQGWVTFDNNRFGDPLVGTFKAGYFRPSLPFKSSLLRETKMVLEIFPERFELFLDQIGADGLDTNHSLSVNVDHVNNSFIDEPSIPPSNLDYGVVLKECGDLTSFTSGFSLVTNLRLYIADNFNTVTTSPPVGSGLAEPFYPPTSLFAPEKRYGGEYDPLSLQIGGQAGTLAGESGGGSHHLFDVKNASDEGIAYDQIEANLSPIAHPAALPPITVMNWLVVIQERQPALYEVGQN